MLDWQSIDTVMFDMDGTLLDLHFDNYFWQELIPEIYSRKHGLKLSQSRQIIYDKYSAVKGTLDWYCMDFWTSSLELNIRDIKQNASDLVSIRPNVESLLQHLNKQGKQLWLVTNAHPDSLDIKLKKTGIGSHFARTFSSHSLKLAKEQSGFWSALQKLQHYDPSRTLLIDDSVAVLRAAKREGIRHLCAIERPDSQLPALTPEEFHQVSDFDQLFPHQSNCDGKSTFETPSAHE